MFSGRGILVTGARGFIGHHIVERARLKGIEVVAAYRGAATRGAISLDVCDDRSVDLAFSQVMPAIVIHCASYGVNYADQDPDRAIAVNIHGALRVLSAAACCGSRLFLHLGSCFEYGSRDGCISEDAPLNPTAIYGATKAAATLLIRERARALGIGLVVARPFGTWGPGEGAHRLIPQVVDACVNQRPLELTSCDVVRDYTYVEDMADRIIALAVAPELPQNAVINIGSGEGVVLRDFVLAVARCLGGEALMRFGMLAQRPTEMKSLVADSKLLRSVVGELPATAMPVAVSRMVLQHR
jgi:nucleoside-diphosphate-sugar epimerase